MGILPMKSRAGRPCYRTSDHGRQSGIWLPMKSRAGRPCYLFLLEILGPALTNVVVGEGLVPSRQF